MTNTIQHDGDTWKILSEGATRNGKTYCPFASTTRSRQQTGVPFVPFATNQPAGHEFEKHFNKILSTAHLP